MLYLKKYNSCQQVTQSLDWKPRLGLAVLLDQGGGTSNRGASWPCRGCRCSRDYGLWDWKHIKQKATEV